MLSNILKNLGNVNELSEYFTYSEFIFFTDKKWCF